MYIRAATEADIPTIVALLKMSLGESLMPKSETFWRWKHIENPFGVSPVLLAFEDDQLIGVRAFMCWQWQQGERTYRAVRAVDTATHPAHQGKGIFKTLTMQLVDQCRQAGVDFIFNTPNASSRPGYLKMGWRSLGKLNVYTRIPLRSGKRTTDFDNQYRVSDALIQGFEFASTTTGIRTVASESFLHWRYRVNPNVSYYGFRGESKGSAYLTVFRLKPNRLGTEFRICEQFATHEIGNEYHNHLMEVVRASGASVITGVQPLRGFPAMGMRMGPDVTIRALSFAPDFLSFKKWKPTLGDMELF